ncbi:MAG: HlyD family efflux transporter periplasmic adaptor subunit, partial [Planctomycetota bacterium]
RETGLAQNPIGQEQHGRLLSKVMVDNEGVLVPPHSGAGGGTDQDDEHAAANPTDFLLVLAPVFNDEGVQGVVEVFQRPGARQATQHGYLRFLLQTCELAGDYLRGRRLKHLSDKQSLWEQLETFTRTAHQKLDIRETAYTIANEGRRLVGCDRVTVAVRYGNRVVLEAISGQDTFDKRSNVARLMTGVAKAVTKTAEDVWYTGDTSSLAPQVEKTLDAYVDESQTKAMAILPLVPEEDEEAINPADEPAKRRSRKPRAFGAIIVEQMVDSHLADGFRQRVDVVRGHSTTAIANAMEHESLFLMPVWKTLGKATSIFRGRALPKTVIVSALVIGGLAYALLAKTDFKLQGDGSLQPVVVRSVFAHVDGEVDEVFVDQKSVVKSGDELLRQRSIDLDKELEQVRGELGETTAELRSLQSQVFNADELKPVERQRLESELAQVQSRSRGLERQFELLELKRGLLVVTSPIDGEVVTSNVREQLKGRPVRPGLVLMEIADTEGDWEVELLMPEKRMAHVNRTIEAREERDLGPMVVEFIPRSQPESTLTGTVIDVDTTAEPRGEDGNTVKVRVKLDSQQAFRDLIATPVVGAEVTANVYCGRCSVAYAWLHDLVDAVRTHIIFPYSW